MIGGSSAAPGVVFTGEAAGFVSVVLGLMMPPRRMGAPGLGVLRRSGLVVAVGSLGRLVKVLPGENRGVTGVPGVAPGAGAPVAGGGGICAGHGDKMPHKPATTASAAMSRVGMSR